MAISSYTLEELEQFKEYIKKHPNANTWTTADGKEIPYRFLKYHHITNIISFVGEYKIHYNRMGGESRTEKLIRDMKRLEKIKLAQMGSIGKILYANPKEG